MSRIWLINPYSSTPSTGMGGRHHYLARELARLGHDVTLVAARRHHLLRQDVDTDQLPEEEIVEGYRFIRIDVPRYSNAHDKRRILAWFVFTARLFQLRRRLGEKPDAVLYSSPHPIGYLAAERVARGCGARLIFEVRDIWPLTLVEVGGFSPRHPFIRFLQWIEDRAYKNADRVVSNLEGAVGHMTTRGMNANKFTWIANGIAPDEVANPDALPADVAAQIPTEGLRIAYTGTLGVANSLETLIDAATLLRDLPDVHVIIVGQGGERALLQDKRDKAQLNNVHFLNRVQKKQVQSVLAACDACYIGWLDSPLYKWGIAANKIPEYLVSGRPVLHSFSGGYDPVVKFDCGITVPAGDPQALANAIRMLHAMPEAERLRRGENGREAAFEHYDYAKLARRMEEVLVA
ncbi:glycosyltransferase family 4 protein [Rhizobium rosettiformans]|uniref:glycosyltransferase family 4 protein n=1 Tax=Rhizobium rosettiformans TaxID=1368430 RepID=UPI00285AB543|nr:glycosyltransferase family 4 protein [Rhizobium rosettiformans]MDR7028998.1 glycosyltransferase involved in cell wall biosynthesis [Rhizobium rosettiformans]MDR7063720.1 glycosyltransferase involved in cell wall biosynthesis [Rhizobium rosettiformans]